LLNNGKVLIAGGSPYPATESAELYDPSTGLFTDAGKMTTPRYGQLATPLVDGRVLLVPAADGQEDTGAEIYDPTTQAFSRTGWGNRYSEIAATATLLTSGKVLVTLSPPECDILGTEAQSYDPTVGQFAAVSSPASGICQPSGTLLSDGTVLIASGWFAGPVAQIYDPTSGSFSHTGDLSIDRHSHTATLLLDGSVLIAGGYTDCCTPVATAEVYHPQVVKPAPRLLAPIQHATTYELVSDRNPAAPGEIFDPLLHGADRWQRHPAAGGGRRPNG
jgi:hypothetical protein